MRGQNREVLSDFRVLIVDDEPLYAMAIAREISRHGLQCDTVFSASEALDRVRSATYQVILLDHRLPDDDGIRLIPSLLARQMTASIIVMTAYDSIPNAIEAIRQGADDYLVKETSIEPIVKAVREFVRKHQVRSGQTGWDEHREGGLLGSSPAITLVREQIRKVAARRDTTVLFTGETGAGKEVAARYLHSLSAARDRPFVAVDCVALPSPLVESLLFGHEKGAFTGADRTKHGAFEEASEGTIFLDEIGEMDLSLQGKFLRVLETRMFQRVGSVREYPVKARIVAATNRDLMEEVTQGRFRFDLYQRLAVFPVHLPPLRERGEDVLVLARHFVRFFGRKMGVDVKPLGRAVEAYLMSYDFPGNVRELKNVIERAIIMSESGRIEPKHLPDRILMRESDPKRSSTRPSLPFDFVPGVDTMETFELKMIRHALEQARGVKSEAARLLGISRFQLLRKIEKYRRKGVFQ